MLQNGREVKPSFVATSVAAVSVAFATMTYELVLAQTLTSIYGNTVTSYSLVIGVFVLSLGLGASYWALGRRPATARTFWGLELALAALGCLAPVLVFRAEFGGAGAFAGGFAATLFFAFAIGSLAGMEIPLLMSLASDDGVTGPVALVVGLDFMGTFVASLVVPLWLFPGLGLLGSSLVASLVNLAMAALILAARRPEKSVVNWGILLVLTALVLSVMAREQAISNYLAKGVF